MDIPLEEYEKLNPKSVVDLEGKKLIFQTPNLITKWRVDTLLTKEPNTIDWLNQIKPKIWRDSIIAWFISLSLSCNAQNSSDDTLAFENAD